MRKTEIMFDVTHSMTQTTPKSLGGQFIQKEHYYAYSLVNKPYKRPLGSEKHNAFRVTRCRSPLIQHKDIKKEILQM